jgi:hypothetical protein
VFCTPQTYCGEISFTSHGIFHGNWIPSEIVRNHTGGQELLVGVNDVKAAKGLKFKFEQFPTNDSKPQGKQFVEWCRTQIDLGSVVVARFHAKDPQEPRHDRIMPVVGYKKDSKN